MSTNPVQSPAAFGRAGALLATLGALFLALNELSSLSSGFLTATNRYWSFLDMTGVRAWFEREHWNDVLTQRQLENWRDLLLAYELLDLAFIAVYALSLVLVIRTVSGVPRVGPGWGKAMRLVLAALVVVDVLEGAGQWWLAMERCTEAACTVPGRLIIIVSVVTTLKWGIVLVLTVGFGWAAVRSWDVVKVRARELWLAVRVQRFSLLAFLPIAALSVLPLGNLNNMFDQLPDAQRAWLDGGTGGLHALMAGVVFGVVVVPTLFFLGRLRADWATRRVERAPWWPYSEPGVQEPNRANPRLWLAGPVAIPIIAGISQALGAEVHWWRLVAFCAVPLVVFLLSWGVRAKHWANPTDPAARSARFPSDVRAVGDILTIAAVSFAGLGMIRAFTGLHALGEVGLLTYDYEVSPVVPALAGAAIAVMPWLLAPWILLLLGAIGDFLPPGDGARRFSPSADRQSQLVKIAMLAIAVGVFVALSFAPRRAADVLGALGAATLAMTTLVVMIGVLVAYVQDQPPLEVFQLRLVPRLRKRDGRRWRSFRSTPVISLFVVALFAASWVGRATDVHAISLTGGEAGKRLPDRPTIEEAFAAWRDQDGGSCRVPYAGDGDFTVRPMLMIGAEGGGVRATYWTAAALQSLGDAGAGEGEKGCASRAALFSAGASGGAVGLVLGRFDEDPQEVADAISGPTALSQAMLTLVSGDLLTSAVGIRFPHSTPYRTPDEQGLDRAGLIETAWEKEKQVAGLRTNFLPEDVADATSDGGSVAGQLILTSSAARDGCRVLVSQVDVSSGATMDHDWPDCGEGVAGDDSYDLFTAIGRTAKETGRFCIGNVPALTAGMIASRFPYVTPSAVVGGCRGMDPSQLIDGGYTDNSGLGTILDLSGAWGAEVRSHNDGVLEKGSGELIVPLIVYLENGTGPEYSPGATAKGGGAVEEKEYRDWWPRNWEVPEVLIPPIGSLNARDHKVKARQALRDSLATAKEQVCTSGGAGGAACDELRESDLVAKSVFVVRQSRQPSIPAPLGWVLSNASQQDLDEDMARQLQVNSLGYGSLRDLLTVLGVADD